MTKFDTRHQHHRTIAALRQQALLLVILSVQIESEENFLTPNGVGEVRGMLRCLDRGLSDLIDNN
jgi:hypothetical protein